MNNYYMTRNVTGLQETGVEINTKEILKEWEEDIKDRAFKLHQKPEFIIIKVGCRDDSTLYVNNKISKAKQLGITPVEIALPETASQHQLNSIIKSVKSPATLQLPLPEHLDATEALSYLEPKFDMDGLTNYQKGLLVSNNSKAMIPATAKGVMKIIESLTSVKALRVLIVSRSQLIGRPLAQLILQKDGVPIVMHSRVPKLNLYSEMKKADVIVTGCGKRKIFNHTHFNNMNQIIIDCSMEKIEGVNGVGDVDKQDILLHTRNCIASGYGHTGPATILGLLDNVIKYYEME